MDNKRHSWLVIIPFFGILVMFLCLSFFLPDHISSEEESRTLTQKPVWDFSDLSALTEDWSDYVVDQFPFRSRFLKAYSGLELLQGKRFTRNTYVTSSDWLMTHIYSVTPQQNEKLVQAVETAYANSSRPFVYAVLPQKNDMLYHMEQSMIDNSASDGNKAQLLAGLDESDEVLVLDVGAHFLDTYSLESRMEMYYKTDFHWNDLGAFRAAEFICAGMREAGLLSELPDSSDFTWQDLGQNHTYQGDLNRRFSNLFSMKEHIPYYEHTDADHFAYYISADDSAPVERAEVVASGLDEAQINYNSVSTDNLGYYRVVNQQAENDACLLILKDSFQNPMIDYFSATYREVNVVDPRYYAETQNFYELLDARNVDMVLFLFHQNNASAELVSFLTPAEE